MLFSFAFALYFLAGFVCLWHKVFKKKKIYIYMPALYSTVFSFFKQNNR